MGEIQCISHMLEIFDFKQVGVRKNKLFFVHEIINFIVLNSKVR